MSFTTDLDASNTSDSDDAGDFIGQSDSSSAGTYVLIKVPNHGSSSFYYQGGSSQLMTSFLRIGAVPDNAPTAESGWDLAQLVVGFDDDTRTRPDDTGVTASTAISAVVKTAIEDATTTTLTTTGGVTTDSSADTFTIDTDVQSLLTTYYGSANVTADQKKRVLESMKLHYRGGWRDHSDGSRISTTRGDKVEVIRGNYKMVVLGRRPALANASAAASADGDYVKTPVDSNDNSIATFDASGGHVQDWNMSPGSITSIAWTEDQYGTWKVTEETVKGDVDSTYHGNVTDWYLGPSVNTKVGWKDAPETDDYTRDSETDASDESIPQVYRDDTSLNRENPVLYEETWAKSITEKTWAKSIESYTGTEDKRVPDVTSKTYAKDVTEYMNVSGTVKTEVHGDIRDEFHYGSYQSEYWGGIAGEQWYGQFGEVFFGGCESFKIGVFTDVRIGGKIAEVNMSILSMAELNMSAMNLVSVSISPYKLDAHFGMSACEANFAAKRFELGVEAKEFTLTKTNLALYFLIG